MYYHITWNQTITASAMLRAGAWEIYNRLGRIRMYAALPEVLASELQQSTPNCVMECGLVVAESDGDSTLEFLVNNDGKRRLYTVLSLKDFFVTCKQRGDIVGIDNAFLEMEWGKIALGYVKDIFGHAYNVRAEARRPAELDLNKFLLTQPVPALQLRLRA